MSKTKKLSFYPLICIGIFLFLLFIGFRLNYYPPILMYHSIGKTAIDTPWVSKQVFAEQMAYLKSEGFKVVSLEELAKFIREGKVRPGMVAITFDDGYKNNLEAVPILNQFGFPATFFVVVHNLDRQGYLNKKDLIHLVRTTFITIGSHTLSHKYLPSLSSFELQKEIVLSKKILEHTLEREVAAISYPIGGFNKEVLGTVEQSKYKCGVTTNRGKGKNIFALKRIKMTNKDLGLNLWAKLSGFYYLFKRARSPN